MKDFDKHIKHLLENPPDVPVQEEVWRKVQGQLRPGRFSFLSFWYDNWSWLLPVLLFGLLMPLVLGFYGAENYLKKDLLREGAVFQSDTLYKRVVVYEYDTIYRRTLVIEEQAVQGHSPVSFYGSISHAGSGILGAVPSLASYSLFARSGALSGGSFWSLPHSFFAPSTGIVLQDVGKQKDEGLRKTPEILQRLSAKKLSSQIFASSMVPSFSICKSNVEAARASALKSSRRSRFVELGYQASQVLLPDAIDLGFTFHPSLFLQGRLEEKMAYSNGLNLSLFLNPRVRLFTGMELMSVNYNEYEKDHFVRYPVVAPPSSEYQLVRVEPYLTYYQWPLGLEFRLHKGEKSLEPYVLGGSIWQKQSRKNHLEYYFQKNQVSHEAVLNFSVYDEETGNKWYAAYWWAGLGADWYFLPSRRNIHLRFNVSYYHYLANLQAGLEPSDAIGLRATLGYTLPFGKKY